MINSYEYSFMCCLGLIMLSRLSNCSLFCVVIPFVFHGYNLIYTAILLVRFVCLHYDVNNVKCLGKSLNLMHTTFENGSTILYTIQHQVALEL